MPFYDPTTDPVALVLTTNPLVASGVATASGNNTLITPTSGKKIRLFYVSYNPLSAVEAGFRFAAAGTIWLKFSVAGSSVITKDFGPAMRYFEGAIDQALILNLSSTVNVNWTVFYAEL